MLNLWVLRLTLLWTSSLCWSTRVLGNRYVHHIRGNHIHSYITLRRTHPNKRLSLWGQILYLLSWARTRPWRVVITMGRLDNRLTSCNISSNWLEAVLTVWPHWPLLLLVWRHGHRHHVARMHTWLSTLNMNHRWINLSHGLNRCLHARRCRRWPRSRHKLGRELLRPRVKGELLGVRIKSGFVCRV